MDEDAETPKGDGNVDSSTKFPAPDHAENIADALARAKEAVGEKAGLRGALAATADTLSRKSGEIAKRRIVPRSGVFHYPDMQARAFHDMLVRPSSWLFSSATGLIRDRLQPKRNLDQVTDASKGSK